MNVMPAVTFVDPNPAVIEALREAFGDIAHYYNLTFEIVLEAALDDAPYDALVSPANSYGLMDGGVDAAITAYFGPELQRRVQDAIKAEWAGEQPVGTCIAVHASLPRNPHLAFWFWILHAPTMRVPAPIVGTLNVYHAFRAVLLRARAGGQLSLAHDESAELVSYPIRKILCPGLGTLTGALKPRVAATQMRVAWDTVRDGIDAETWQAVAQHSLRLRFPARVMRT